MSRNNAKISVGAYTDVSLAATTAVALQDGGMQPGTLIVTVEGKCWQLRDVSGTPTLFQLADVAEVAQQFALLLGARTGLATIPQGSPSVTVAFPGVTAGSRILATIQQAAMDSVLREVITTPGTDSFDITGNGNATDAAVTVAWFVASL